MESQPSFRRYIKIIILGFVVHVLLVLAAFDLYFASPLDHGMSPIKTTDEAPSKRLVLFVADGLRAEAVYGQDREHIIPFLTRILKEKGSWGVSHTRVPTESRPGHVALLGGIYEDPSALFKGWKQNPVYFDSVINQSTNAWCWGSPDIVTIFNRDNLPHIKIHAYGSEIEDFGKNATEVLDQWVFDRVNEDLSGIENCVDCKSFFQEGNLFFLHLLGIDTAGHAYKPYSKEYSNNIKMVDKNIEKMYTLFENTFKDHSTSYLFTADHGMTDWGSHGAGSDHETQTPFIAWGSGIQIDSERKDLNQIDIAPLISSLIGINIPINSLGKVPFKYINTSKMNIAKLLISNTRQLLEIFNTKRIRIQKNSIAYFPFKSMTSEYIASELEDLDNLQRSKKFDDVIKKCDIFIDEIILGIDYYHYYYQKAILISVTIGFLIWMLILLVSTFSDKTKTYSGQLSYILLYVCSGITICLCYREGFPATYYFYFLFPVISLFIALQDRHVIKNILVTIKNYGVARSSGDLFLYFLGLELLVLGFNHRWSYSLLLVVIGAWIIVPGPLQKNTSRMDKILWIFCSLVLSVFPTLPVMTTTFNIPLYIFGSLCWILYFVLALNRLNIYQSSQNVSKLHLLFSVQVICLVLSVVYVLAIALDYASSTPDLNFISILLAVIPALLISYFPKLIHIRLMSIHFGFAPYFMLVSTNYEIIFLCFFTVMLNLWLHIECKTLQRKGVPVLITTFATTKFTDNVLKADTLRQAFLFIVFIFIGFFGTGNIASINSFDPMWVRAFLTVFSPFKMTILILIKIIIPFLFVCCTFRAINISGKQNILRLFCIILLFADIIVLQCLYLITNKGSWLDIGTSLSHFLIMEAFVIVILLLYTFSQILTGSCYLKSVERTTKLL